MLRPQRVLSFGDATRLGAKSHRQNCCAPKTSDGKTPSKFFGLSHTRTSVLLWLGTGTNRRRLLRRGFTPPLAKTAEGIDHFSSALPLGRGFHSPLWRQTTNNGTSWRLICASRARSRAGARLGRASRACSPPIYTILRRLIKLVCALLRFRERSRTIKVLLATSSSQNHRKSFTQSCLVLSIKYRH